MSSPHRPLSLIRSRSFPPNLTARHLLRPTPYKFLRARDRRGEHSSLFHPATSADMTTPPRRNHMPKVIDVHAHILDEATMRLISKEAPSIGLSFKPIDQDFAVFEIGGIAYKPFPRGAWDLEQRFKDMKAA